MALQLFNTCNYTRVTYPPREIPVPTSGASGYLDFTYATTTVRSSVLAAQYVLAVCSQQEYGIN